MPRSGEGRAGRDGQAPRRRDDRDARTRAGLERTALPPALRRSTRGDPVGAAPAWSPPAVDPCPRGGPRGFPKHRALGVRPAPGRRLPRGPRGCRDHRGSHASGDAPPGAPRGRWKRTTRPASAPVSPRSPPPWYARGPRRRGGHRPPVPTRPAGARCVPVRLVDSSRRAAMAARPATAPRLRGPGRLRAAPRGDRGVSRRGTGRALRGVAGSL